MIRRITSIFFATAFITVVGRVAGQSADIHNRSTVKSSTIVGIGQRVPNFVMTQVMQYSAPSVSFTGLHGKLTILDFWATYCSPCVGFLPRAAALQTHFGDKVQFLLVGTETDTTAKPLLVRQGIQLPNAVGVYEPLAKMFGVPALGTYVWIDGDGSVRGVTDHTQVTAENIQAILDHRPVILEPVVGYGVELIPFNHGTPLFLNQAVAESGLVQYQSVFTNGLPGTGPYAFRGSGPYRGRRVGAVNKPGVTLYREAAALLPGRAGLDYLSRTRLEMVDSTRLTEFKSSNVYSYDLIVPQRQSSHLGEMMLADLDRFFGTRSQFEKRRAKVVVLARGGTAQTPLAPYVPVDSFMAGWGCPHGEGQLRYVSPGQDGQYYTLAGLLEALLRVPVIDETGLRGTVDLGATYRELTLEKHRTPETYRNALDKYGITLHEEEREVEMLIVSDGQ